MEDHITLTEIYVYNPKLFKNKNLRSFIKNHKIQEHDTVKLKTNKIAIKQSWVKKNLPTFNLKLREMNNEVSGFFEVKSILDKYQCKAFNPTNLNLDSTMVTYFLRDNKRTPYFNHKGLIKVMVHFNDLDENIFKWIHELSYGSLQSQVDNLHNILEMVHLKHIPIIKNINGRMVLSNQIVYNVTTSDIIADFKRVGDLKKEPNLASVIDEYKCPVYTQFQNGFRQELEDAENKFNSALKELKQEKVIQHLRQELDKEKSLKDQMFSLTQSFIPMMNDNQLKPSFSPEINSFIRSEKPLPDSKRSDFSGKLKPSKIQ